MSSILRFRAGTEAVNANWVRHSLEVIVKEEHQRIKEIQELRNARRRAGSKAGRHSFLLWWGLVLFKPNRVWKGGEAGNPQCVTLATLVAGENINYGEETRGYSISGKVDTNRPANGTTGLQARLARPSNFKRSRNFYWPIAAIPLLHSPESF